MKTLRNVLIRLSYFPQTIRLVWAATRGWTIWWLAVLSLLGLLPATLVYLSRHLVDSLVAAINAGATLPTITPVVYTVAAVFGVMLLTELLQSISEWIRATQAELVQDKLYTLIHEKSAVVDIAFYESPEYYDKLHRAREDAGDRSLTLIESTGNLLKSSITIGAIATLLLPYSYWMPLALLTSTLPAFFVVIRHSLRYHKWWKETTPDRRRTFYYENVLTYDDYAAELRLFDLGSYFQKEFDKLRLHLRTGRLKLVWGESWARFGTGGIAILVTGSCMIWMGWRTLHGLSTLGDLTLFYQAFNRGQTLMRSLLSHLGDIYSNSLFLGNLFEFLDLSCEVKDPTNPVTAPTGIKKGISFKHVAFKYPGSRRDALTDFNLIIPPEKIVAVVGANGAGKSTLVKLLCRLYDPNTGYICIDGIDICRLSLKELRRMITVMFQKPVQYHTSASENIAISKIHDVPDRNTIEKAAKSAGAHEVITRLAQGYNTPLGKWFVDGTELSSGEWQRIALARAFLRKAPLVILDEPTSFMDSWGEAEWLERFRTLVKGQTTLIITHRFTTAMQADVIHVMDKGRIIESGSHDQLLLQAGVYAQSWETQMKARSI